MKRAYIYDLSILLIILYCSVATFLSSPIKFASGNFDSGFYILIAFSAIYLFMKKGKLKIPTELIIFFMLWFLINTLGSLLFSSSMQIDRVIRYFFTLFLLPFSALILVGQTFWSRIEKVIYFLTVLSLPLFLLNNLFPNLFNSLGNIFHSTTYDRLAVGSYWSALFYVNAIYDFAGAYLRNCGFMWEPGAFAMMIIIGIILNWLYNGISLNRKFLIYFVSLITTFSTAGYIAIFVLISAKYVNKLKLINFILLSISVFIFVVYIYQQEFIGGEVNLYLEAYQDKSFGYDAQNMAFKGNRFVGAYFDLLETLRYPLGYGLIKKSDFESGFDITGVSGLSNLMKMWGIPIFIYLMYLLWRFIKIQNRKNISLRSLSVMYLSLLMMFFSNPIQRNTLIYLMFISAIIFYNNINKKLPNNFSNLSYS